MTYAKAILFAYPYLDDAVSAIDKQIDKRCRLSFYSTKPCFDYAEKISQLISDKRHLLYLKEKIDKILSRLSEEERSLLGYKYFNNRPIDGFDYKSRKYFRQQIRILGKFKRLLDLSKITEDVFYKEYANVPYIRSILIRLEEAVAA